jgi:hypothetical protein
MNVIEWSSVNIFHNGHVDFALMVLKNCAK